MSTDTPNLATATSTAIEQVDVRGPRCAAWVTTAVLLIALIVSAVSTTAAAAILAAQAVVFAIGAIFVGLPWVVLHYMTKWKTAATLTTGDEALLEELTAREAFGRAAEPWEVANVMVFLAKWRK